MWIWQWNDNDIKPQTVIETFLHYTNLLPNMQVLLRVKTV